jgi:hypothetical protein
MKNRALNRHKAHKSPQSPVGAPSPGTVVRLRDSRRRLAAASACLRGGVSGASRPRGRVLLSPGESLNWRLRRYVRTSSLRVWLRRQGAAAGGASAPAGRPGIRRHSLSASSDGEPGRPEKSVTGYPASDAAACRGAGIRGCRYRIHRNRQMGYFTQVAAGLRGGVWRGAAITPRERTAAWDLVLTTLSDVTHVESNIFRFVMT